MLENVLHWSVSQLSGFRPQKETVLVHSIIEEQTTILSSVFTTKNINIQNLIPSKLQLTIDKNHLVIIIRNLLHNAIKFTHSNGHIQLSYSCLLYTSRCV